MIDIFTHHDLGNITSITMKDRSKQLVGYNSAGEVVKTEHLLDAAGTDKRQGGNFAWTYDGIGNRLSAARGGDSTGANLRASTYTPNALNQYDSVTQPGAVDVTGRAPAADTVTVNGAPASRQGERFHREATADNSGGPVWKEILVGNGTDNLDGFSLIPPATRTPVHDADGNLTHDGVYQYTWDAENRLIKIETLATTVNAGVPYQRVEYLYDSNWRRVQRKRYAQSTGAAVEHTRYLWAGWRCLAEVDASGELSKTFVWGLDSSQSLHLGDSNGALLWINDLVEAQRHFCHYDGNGNITGLSDASGTQTAEYLYNAFGELLERSGAYADKNLYRFSTKPFEVVGGLYYYGYRYYDPATGRWPSRDPIEEQGGLNLYGFVRNNGVNWVDLLGMKFVGDYPRKGSNTIKPLGDKEQELLNEASSLDARIKKMVDDLAKAEDKYIIVECMSDAEFKNLRETFGAFADVTLPGGEHHLISEGKCGATKILIRIPCNASKEELAAGADGHQKNIITILVHELQHAWDDAFGHAAYRDADEYYVNPGSKVAENEQRAVRTENIAREAMMKNPEKYPDIKIRTTYGGLPVTNPESKFSVHSPNVPVAPVGFYQ